MPEPRASGDASPNALKRGWRRLNALVHTLRFRLAAMNLLVFGIILVLVLAAVLMKRERQLREDFDEWLVEHAEHVVHEVIAHAADGRAAPSAADDPLHSHEYYFEVRGADESVIRRSANLRNCSIPLSPTARASRVLEPVFENIQDECIAGLPDGEAGIRLLTQFHEEPGGVPFYLLAGASLHQLHHTIAEQRQLLFGVALPVGLLVVGLGSWFLASRALRPLRKITEDARKLTVDRLSHRLGLATPKGELAEMVAGLNDMLDRLEEGFRAQERFLAEVSHELKTPIAVLLGQAQVLSRRARSPEEYDDFVASVESEMQRLSEVVRSFMLLARANAGVPTALAEAVSVNELVMRAVVRCHALASHREVRLVPVLMPTGEEEEGVVQGDEELLCSMLVNLIMNAVRHSPVGEAVEVEVCTDGSEAAIAVRDRGSGLSPDMLEKVFEPFVSASCGTAPGMGLGLTIARSVAQLHGGGIQAANRAGAGCEFVIRLPLRPPA